MAMQAATRQRLGGAFLNSLPLSSRDAREWAGYQFDMAADRLPEPEAWAVLGRDEAATLLLVAGDWIFTLTRKPLAATGLDSLEIVVASYPVRITAVRYRRQDLRTFWDFEFRWREALSIEGQINYRARPEDQETFDQPEALARALARRAGWAA